MCQGGIAPDKFDEKWAPPLLIGLEELFQGWQAALDWGVGSQTASDPLWQFSRAIVACVALIEQYNRAVVLNVPNTPPYGLIHCTIGLQCVPSERDSDMSGAQYAAQIFALVLPVAVEQSQTLLPLRVEFFFQYYLQIFPKKAMGKPTLTQIGQTYTSGKGMPITITARALWSLKSSPSLTLPRQTAQNSAGKTNQV
jgi:hypothetical protein